MQPVPPVARVPENGVRLVGVGFGRVYAAGQQLFRSEDGGRRWANLTAFKTGSVVGLGQRSLAGSPGKPGQIVGGNAVGGWRAMDGGLAWRGSSGLFARRWANRLLG